MVQCSTAEISSKRLRRTKAKAILSNITEMCFGLANLGAFHFFSWDSEIGVLGTT